VHKQSFRLVRCRTASRRLRV